ncbi:MAG: FHA domain-containing protein [Isosphaeraceae bacterium]
MIGRTEGDLQFPLDGRMSARHVEITLQVVGGSHRWVITDLQSTHGMFVRVSKTPLADRAEILVGGGRYRFEAAQVVDDRTIDQPGHAGPDTARTQGLDEATAQFRPAALTELIGREIGNRIVLVKDEYWIGSDPACAIGRADDPFCEGRHVRIARNRKGQWVAEHHKTQNGLWLRMSQIPADSQVMFQVGEQRFRLRVD